MGPSEGSWAAPGRFWAAPGRLLGRSWRLLGLPGAALGPSWSLLGSTYGLLGLSWGALERSGRLQSWLRLKTRKSSTVQHFSWFFEPPGLLLGPPEGSWWLMERPSGSESGPGGPSGSQGGPWEARVAPEVAPGHGPKGPRSRRNHEASETRAVFLLLTRVDPCIKCTRSKLELGQVVFGSVVSKDLLSVCGNV